MQRSEILTRTLSSTLGCNLISSIFRTNKNYSKQTLEYNYSAYLLAGRHIDQMYFIASQFIEGARVYFSCLHSADWNFSLQHKFKHCTEGGGELAENDQCWRHGLFLWDFMTHLCLSVYFSSTYKDKVAILVIYIKSEYCQETRPNMVRASSRSLSNDSHTCLVDEMSSQWHKTCPVGSHPPRMFKPSWTRHVIFLLLMSQPFWVKH